MAGLYAVPTCTCPFIIMRTWWTATELLKRSEECEKQEPAIYNAFSAIAPMTIFKPTRSDDVQQRHWTDNVELDESNHDAHEWAISIFRLVLLLYWTRQGITHVNV